MSNPLKQLAGETAIYGLSTILARIVNFLLVPLYTRVLVQSDYGVVTEFMAYIAIFQVVLTLGLETGCFRFASRSSASEKDVFSHAFATVASLGSLFFIASAVFSNEISSALGYPGFGSVIIYVGAILLIDCSTAVLFARLRYEHKALKFAVIKTVKIFTEVGVNIFLYLSFPAALASGRCLWMQGLVSPVPDFTYAIFAIFASCIVSLVLLLPDLARISLKPDGKLWKELMLYSLPLMIAGLPGVLNDFLDRVLMRFLNADPVLWRADLGVYQAGVKIAVIMQLFIQMFRYASEPFFFQRDSDKGGRKLYARVMNWFTAFCIFGFLFIMLFIDKIGLILGRDFREGLSIAPVMLMAYILLGMLFNVNMWYKLSGKTGYAVWITLAGLVVTIVINALWMPVYSYHAAAWSHLASYALMLLISVLLGNRHYRIPYSWGVIALLFVMGLLLYGLSTLLPNLPLSLELLIGALFLAAYCIPAYFLLRKTDNKLKI